MKLYAIVGITAQGSSVDTVFAIEPLGIYSSINTALDYVNKLESLTLGKSDKISYDIFEFIVDQKPMVLDWLEKEKEISKEVVDNAIIDLMNKGMVDQLVGEDGHFYYTLTENGKKIAKEYFNQPFVDLIKQVRQKNDDKKEDK